MESLSTQELIAIVDSFDKGDVSVTVDQHDDAIEQLQELAHDGDEDAQYHFDQMSDVD